MSEYYKNKPSIRPENKKAVINVTDPNTTRKLQLNEIKLSVQLTKEQIFAQWGSPNAIEGSGVEYWVYNLEDERLLWLLFASQSPQPLLKAIIFLDSNDTKGSVIFDGMNETKLR